MILGQKTILFDALGTDIPYLAALYRHHQEKLLRAPLSFTAEELQGHIARLLAGGSWQAYIGMTKEDVPRRLGCFYLTNVTPHACTVNGMLDQGVLKGLAKRIKKSYKMGPSFAEDALTTLLTSLPQVRVDAYIQASNALALRLCRVTGFQQEGVLRQAVRVNGHAEDLIVLSVIRLGGA